MNQENKTDSPSEPQPGQEENPGAVAPTILADAGSTRTDPPTPVTLRSSRKQSRKSPAPRRGKGIYVGLAIVFGVLALGILPRIGNAQKLAENVKYTKDTFPSVSVVSLKPASDASGFTLPGNIQAAEQTTINARTTGYLQAMNVDIGSSVKKGQVLAVIESPEVDQQLSQAEAEFARAQAGSAQAAADVEKQAASIAGSQADVSRVLSGLEQARADLIHLEAKEQQAEASVRVAEAKVVESQRKLDGAKSDLNRALVGQSIAKKTLDRWRQLEAAQAVSGQEVDEKESDFESREAQVEAARAAVSSAEAVVLGAQEAAAASRSDVKSATADIESGKERIHAAESAVTSSRSGVRATEAGYQASRSNVEAARAGAQSALANTRRLSAMKLYEQVVAPFAGVITARNVDVGDLINPTSGGNAVSDQNNAVPKGGLFGLARTDVLRAKVDVPEMYVGSIREGQTTQVTTEEYPNRVFSGQVWHMAGALDATSRTLLVDIKIPNGDGALKPGMSAQVRFTSSGVKAYLKIPAIALIINSSGQRVQIVTDKKTIHYVNVRLGRDYGDTVEILSGLEGNETIVTNPDETMKEGQSVSTQTATS